jgi:hypothetical protein
MDSRLKPAGMTDLQRCQPTMLQIYPSAMPSADQRCPGPVARTVPAGHLQPSTGTSGQESPSYRNVVREERAPAA